MNVLFPAGIEHYLRESGFTDTEIMVLKKLLEENLLTIRELATKTGKSNGVIDVALKKLLRRGIVAKEKINENPKYAVIDAQVIVTCTKKNLEEQTATMQRKHQSFAQFMEQLSVDKSLPDIEHFSGKDGFFRAYDRLLEKREEMLTYFDPATIAENDPLSEFRMYYARRRQVHGVVQRIIAPDSPVARRFRSRDPFEYRKTLLVPAEYYPMVFEKIITGETVACLDATTMNASFIRFPKLAESERTAFELLWKQQNVQSTDLLYQPVTVSTSTSSLWNSSSLNGFQKTVLASSLSLFIFWLLLLATRSTGGFYNYLYSFLFSLIPLVSGALGIVATKRWGGLQNDIGKAVFSIGLGIFLWGCGGMAWSYYNFAMDIPAPYPSYADLGFAPGIFFYSLGVLYLSSATGAKIGLRNMYAQIFVVIAPMVTLAFSYYVFIILARGGVLFSPDDSGLKIALDLLYPIADFLALTLAILISSLSFPYMGGRYRLEILAILSGIAVMFIGDSVFSYTTTIGTFYNGNFGDLILTIGVCLLSFGVLGFCGDKKGSVDSTC